MVTTQNDDPSESSDSPGTSVEPTAETDGTGGSADETTFTRRAAMAVAGLAGVGLLAGGTGTVGADEPRMRSWNRDVDARGHALCELGALQMAGSGPIVDFAGENLTVENGVLNAAGGVVDGVRYVDVADGAAAVQDAVDRADAEGLNGVVVYGDEGEWNRTVRLPSDFTLEIRDGVTIRSTMDVTDAETFEVGDGTTAAALITNADPEIGNENITVRGGFIDFSGVSTGGAVWAPVWLHDCEDGLFDSIRVENASGRGGVMFSDCRNSTMIDCVTRNIGYDGIALTLDCRGCDVVRCEASECGGPGIQAATFGRGAGAPRGVTFTDCRTDEMIAVHGYEIAGGARNITVQGCTARRIGIIGEVRDFRITDCDVDAVALSALDETIRNGRIDSVTMGERVVDPFARAATILWAWGGLIENVSFSNCTAQTDGHIERFVETRLLSEDATARYVDYTNCAFDGDGAEAARFVQHTPDGEAHQQSVGELSNVRIHGCKIWNVDYAVEGAINGLRVRDTELHEVGDLHDGGVTDLKTDRNDWW